MMLTDIYRAIELRVELGDRIINSYTAQSSSVWWKWAMHPARLNWLRQRQGLSS